jgi:acetyl-CoA carboxylase biotin carboxyl carrier protein
MSQEIIDHSDAQLVSKTTNNPNVEGPHKAGEEYGELLEQVRRNALRFLSDLPRPPRALRVRAGGVSVDIEWGKERAIAADTETVRDAPPSAAVTESTTELISPVEYLSSPTVGVFYHAPEPTAPPFVNEGDMVAAGQQVGIVEAMKLMIPVVADKPGRVVKVLKDNGQPVEYDERLFALAVVDAA